jgi:hypothetical protein
MESSDVFDADMQSTNVWNDFDRHYHDHPHSSHLKNGQNATLWVPDLTPISKTRSIVADEQKC